MADMLPITVADMIAEAERQIDRMHNHICMIYPIDPPNPHDAAHTRSIAVMEEIVRYLKREQEPT